MISTIPVKDISSIDHSWFLLKSKRKAVGKSETYLKYRRDDK